MLRALTTLALCAALGCDGMPGKPDPADRELLPSEVRDFGRLYAENCAGCHGPEGRDGAANPLADPRYASWVPDTVLRAVIAHGRPGTAMPAFAVRSGGALTDEQVEILASDIRSRWGGQPPDADPAMPSYAASDAGDVQRGAQVFATFCARCHDARGDEGSGGSVVDPSYLALVSDAYLRTVIVAGRSDALAHPDWKSYVPDRPMTPEAIADVVAWLASHREGWQEKRSTNR